MMLQLPAFENENVFGAINSKIDTHRTIANLIIPTIYKDCSKDFAPLEPGYNYVGGYNYFMGMRLTYRKSKLEVCFLF